MSLGDVRLTRGEEDPQRHTPVVSLVLAFAAMVPVVAGAGLVLLARQEKAAAILERQTLGWTGAVLCFLAGVRRGLSFRQPGGTPLRDLGAMFWLFVLGAGGILIPRRRPAIATLLLGYGSLGVLDTEAARHGDAPRYFARLRPVQLILPVSSLLALLLRRPRSA